MTEREETVREIIKRRDGATDSDVDGMFEQFTEYVDDGEDPEDAMATVFGLEPDYLFDREVLKALRV